jgi:TRAP-type C4-dicarboxylate transport system substrate-binding protein
VQTRRITQWAAVAVLAGLAMALAACGGSGSDKAGGIEEQKPVVLKLTMANPNDDRPPQLEAWAEEVSRLSAGTLAIEFKDAWRAGEPRYEAGTLEDVRAGKVDVAWVGARAFDTVGVTSFQALVAPLLIDSYDLEAKVFEQGIPERMLEGVGDLDLVGIGALPGPMRKLLGVSKPFIRPGDFAGQVAGLQDSAVAAETMRALGATPRAVPSGAKLDGLDAYEQQLGAIWGNRYNKGAKYVSANVNFWPRPLVIVIDKEAFASLTDEQQSSLRDAAAAAIPKALEASRAEDAEAAPPLCKRGMTFAVASESDLAELRSALEPVYADLRADPKTKSNIDAITDLKKEIAASAEAPTCTSTEPATTASPIPDGTYETTLTKADWRKMTKADWRKSGVSEEVGAVTGVFRMTFDAGEWTLLGPNGDDDGEKGSYTVFRDQIEIHPSPEWTITARWSFDDKKLTFTDIGGNGYVKGLTVLWASHPWMKTG